MPLRRLRTGRALLAAFLVLAVVAGSMALDIARPTPASAAPVWNDGPIEYSTILNCPSVIGGYPYLEHGMGALVGAPIDTAAPAPVVNETFQIRVVFGGVGFACDPQRAFIDIKLPPGVSPAITAGDPIRCYLNAQAVPANECPQQLGTGSAPGYLSIPAPQAVPFAPAFPFSRGEQIELRIPVKASATMTNAPLESRIHVIDGNDNPILRPHSTITVFAADGGGGSTPAEPTLSYPTPSTTDLTATSAKSHVYITPRGTSGTLSFEIGTGGSTTNVAVDVDPTWLGFGYQGGREVTDWPGVVLEPETTYYWRARYRPSDGERIYGPVQSFTTLPLPHYVVGTGTPASCTTTALSTALSDAVQFEDAKLTFSCGSAPHSISMASTPMFTKSVTIDGGNLITLRAPDQNRHFAFNGGDSKIENLTLTGGNHPQCGGSIRVTASQGQSPDLTLDNVQLHGNHAAQGGGAICVEGDDAHVDLFTVMAWDNSTGGDGGVAYVYGGSLLAIRGEWRDNTAKHGGAAAAHTGGLELGRMALVENEAIVHGGAVDLFDSTLSMNTTTLSGNKAPKGSAVRGDGGSRAWIDSTTVAENVAQAGGAALEVTSINVSMEVEGSLMARNVPQACTPNSVATEGLNRSDDTSCNLWVPSDAQGLADIGVGPLAQNGGVSRTHALLPGSPAIDSGGVVWCGFFDQRGYYNPETNPGDPVDRWMDGDGDGTPACDAGAYELHPGQIPGTPAEASAAPSGRSVTVTWSAPVLTGDGPVTGYLITAYLDGVVQGTADVSSTTRSHTFQDLQPGRTYTFRVAAKNASGVGATSSSTVTIADVPAPVAKPQASAGTRSATVSWTAPATGGSAITGYVVTPYRNGVAQAAINVSAAARSHQLTGLDAGVPYAFRVAARNAVGTGPRSALSEAVTPTAPGGPGGPKPPPPPHGFPDVPGNAYFDAAVRWLKAEGITSGVGSTGLFKPNDAVTRAQMATFLWRLMGSPSTSKAHGFPDVPRGAYYDEAVRWLKAAGITGGVGDTGLFKPNDPVTRAQMAAFLHRLVSSPSVGAGHGFADVPSSAYYDMAVRWLKATGITTGVGGTNRFAPNDVVNRAQMAAFLHRLASTPSAWSKVPPSKIPPTVTF